MRIRKNRGCLCIPSLRPPTLWCALLPSPIALLHGVWLANLPTLVAPIIRPSLPPWLGKLASWLAEGRSPYLFIHTPDNSDAPLLAAELVARVAEHLQALHPGLPLPSVTLNRADSDRGQIGLAL